MTTVHMASRPDFPNFDYWRLAAAFTVLLHHSFTVGQPGDSYDPVILLTGQHDFPSGTYAVCVFLLISGFLVTKSARENALPTFVASRLLRIFPGLFICQLVTALMIGSAFSTMGAPAFISSLTWLRYAVQYTLDPGMTWALDTVTFYPSPDQLGRSFNASLWSLQAELICYAIILLLMIVRSINWVTITAMLILTLPFVVPWSRDDVTIPMSLVGWRFADQRLSEFLWVASSFFMGGLIYFFWKRIGRFPRWPLAVCAGIFVLAIAKGRYYDLFPLYAAYPIITLGMSSRFALPSLKPLGDLSYGIYLYGWPYQQIVRAWIGPDVTWLEIFLIAGIAATATAWLSWRLIERPALSIKRRLRPRS